MNAWATSVLPAVLAATALYAFYRTTEIKWPVSYYTLNDVIDSAVATSPIRYGLFRFAPVYVAGVILTNTAGNPAQSLTTFAVLHIQAGPGLAITRAATRKQLNLSGAAAYVLVIAGVLISCALAATTSSLWSQILPGFDKYVETLLTAIVTTVLFFTVSQLTSRNRDTYVDGEHLMGRVSREEAQALHRAAAEAGVDRDLALAILITEKLNRPAWFRKAETVLHTIGLARTLGPLQTDSEPNVPLADSFTAAMIAVGPAHVPRSWGSPSSLLIVQYFLERHNPSAAFIDAAGQVFDRLQGLVPARSDTSGKDGSSGLRLLGHERSGDRYHIWGDASPYIRVLRGQSQQRGSEEWAFVDVSLSVASEAWDRSTWSTSASIFDEAVLIGAGEIDTESGGHTLRVPVY